MKKVLIILLLLVIPSLSVAFPAKVTKVLDGDTIYVYDGLTYIKISLCGIDSPEMDQAYGTESKKFLQSVLASRVYNGKIMEGKLIDIDTVKVEKDGEHLAWISLRTRTGWLNINHELVKAGLARYSRNTAPGEIQLAELEKAARKKSSGLWNRENPIKP